MSKTYHIQLEENDLGQILDGLREREKSWRRTADYIRSGGDGDDAFAIEECSDEHEAESIAKFYSRIIRDLEGQRKKQGGCHRSLQTAPPMVTSKCTTLDGCFVSH